MADGQVVQLAGSRRTRKRSMQTPQVGRRRALDTGVLEAVSPRRRGKTGCRYVADPERRRQYVRTRWNLTGDAYLRDDALLEHPKVLECGVMASPGAARGDNVKTLAVVRHQADAARPTVEELLQFVKAEIPPYKYPSAGEFVESLPRIETGELQRFKLRQVSLTRAEPA